MMQTNRPICLLIWSSAPFMTPLSVCTDGTQVTAEKRPLSKGAAFYLLASITISYLAGASAPTPLYALYQAQWGFSPITVTIIFGVYAISVLVALLFLGRLSDHLGRRPVLIATTAAQTAAMVIFATASGVGDLMLARIIQGLATGAALGAVGAGMIDLNKARGATANAVAPTFGTATGGMLSGYLVQYLPAPTYLVYAVLCVIFVLQGIGVALMTDTIAPAPGALASLKPQLTLPAAVRGPLLLALPVLLASWALAGFYGSLGPMLVRGMLGVGSALLGGLALFVLAASAGLAVLVLQHREPRAMMTFGASLLAAGVGVAIWSLSHHSIGVFFAGTSIAGMGFGSGFQGAVRSVVPLAAPHERAGVLSIVFVASYLSMGVPAIAAGALVARHGNILGIAKEFGIAVMTLALAAVLAAGLRLATGRTRRTGFMGNPHPEEHR
jgi:predicted MFS family arabinose efflux permease